MILEVIPVNSWIYHTYYLVVYNGFIIKYCLGVCSYRKFYCIYNFNGKLIKGELNFSGFVEISSL